MSKLQEDGVQPLRIWDRGSHNAFTDLTRVKGSWYCVFRESRDHMGGTGRIRVLQSANGREWISSALLAQRGVDLRDPKLTVTPSNELMLLAGGTVVSNGRPTGRRPRVAFSSDGARWSRLQPVLDEGDWLWRVTWHNRRAYGITYRLVSSRIWTVALVVAPDGVNYEKICDLSVSGKPNEATIRFHPDGRAFALVRREGGDRHGWLGSSLPPYCAWQWSSVGVRLGGPNFLVLPDGTMWGATRIIHGREANTWLGPLTEGSFMPAVKLPSGGDCSYAGLVWFRSRIWVSYYSSHEGKASVYFSSVALR